MIDKIDIIDEIMDKITAILNEIQDKKGKEWIGLQAKTEQQLEALMYYLDNSKVRNNPKLVDQLTELYYIAKASNFVKMEGIIRKLDQLKITLGKIDSFERREGVTSTTAGEKRVEIVNYAQAIDRLKKEIEDLMLDPYGMSLPEISQNYISTFLGFLYNPKLPNKQKLFEDMLEKYKEAKTTDFTKMQTFSDLLNMCEIKLGAAGEIKKWKSIDEIKQELAEEQEKLTEAQKNLEAEQKKLEAEQKKLEAEKERMKLEKEKLEEDQKIVDSARKDLEFEQEQIEVEKKKIKVEREQFNEEKKKLEAEQNKLKEEWSKIGNAMESLKAEKEKLNESMRTQTQVDESNNPEL